MQYSNKMAKNSKLTQFSRVKVAIIASFILSLEYALLTFLLLTVYDLFISHYIFKDLIGKNKV